MMAFARFLLLLRAEDEEAKESRKEEKDSRYRVGDTLLEFRQALHPHSHGSRDSASHQRYDEIKNSVGCDVRDKIL